MLIPPQGRAPNFPPRSAISVLPEAIEAAGVHLRIPRRVGDLAMPEVRGEGPRIDTLVHEFEAAGMAQQVTPVIRGALSL